MSPSLHQQRALPATTLEVRHAFYQHQRPLDLAEHETSDTTKYDFHRVGAASSLDANSVLITAATSWIAVAASVALFCSLVLPSRVASCARILLWTSSHTRHCKPPSPSERNCADRLWNERKCWHGIYPRPCHDLY